ncbi:hypothetical protein GPN2_20175 [Streptomyces murinus]
MMYEAVWVGHPGDLLTSLFEGGTRHTEAVIGGVRG